MHPNQGWGEAQVTNKLGGRTTTILGATIYHRLEIGPQV